MMIHRRRGSAKSRSGCGLCKQRKIKCDEGKPSCQQCLRKNRVCPGYSINVRFSSKHEVHATSSQNDMQTPRLVDSTHITINKPSHTRQKSQLSKVLMGRNQDELRDSILLGHGSSPIQPKSETAAHDSPSTNGFNALDQISSPEVSQSSPISSDMTLFILSSKDKTSRSPRPLQQPIHGPTFLINYWFTRICPDFATFDSPKNPFKIYVDYAWHHSPSIFYAMQSMAAACVDDHIPQIKSISVHLRGEATRILRREIGYINFNTNAIIFQELFLACFMLGLSGSWHDSRDLGLVYYEAAQELVTKLLNHPRTLLLSEQQCVSFCKKGLIYWQMLTAAIRSENSIDSGLHRDVSLSVSPIPMGLPPAELTLPHPFTGLADVAQELIANAIALSKQPRTPENLKIAFDLEERLLSLDIPTRNDVQDTLDDKSPNWHFSLVAEAYKNTGLLHLYKSFRPLVECRLNGVENEVHSAEHWLASLAVFILNIISQIPPSSGTRCTQPLAILISAAALRLPNSVFTSDLSSSSDDLDSMSLQAEIAQSRIFAMDRLHCYERSLPPKPIATAIKLVKEVWRQLDEGKNVEWMDVMEENSLQTIFG